MLVRDILLHVTNLAKLYDKAILVKFKEVTESSAHWSLIENVPKGTYDCVVDEFNIWYGNMTSTIKELEVYLTYKKGDTNET